MADHDFSIKRRLDGSIDFDAYRAEAARARQAARKRIVWEVALPFLWSAPIKLVTRTKHALVHRRSGLSARRL